MAKFSRRVFLKRSVAVGAGAMLMLYSDGSYRMVMAAEAETFKLRILHTNDHHAHIEPVMTSSTPPEPQHGGVSRRKTLIDKARSENSDLLLLDAGDVFQGTLYFNQYGGMADLEFYNALKYDAMTIGNHEFDNGPGQLTTFIQSAGFPVLGANIVINASNPLASLVKPNTIIERAGKKIGIFGLTTEETAVLASPGPDVSFRNPIEVAREQVAALKAQGVDAIIALTHIGITNDRQLAREVSGISMIIGGHSHTPMGPMISPADPSKPYPEVISNPDGNGTVVVTDWEWGRWLGDLTVGFDANGVISSISANPVEVAGSIEPDAGFEARIAELAQPLETLRATVIGETAVALNGARGDVRTKETNLANLIADAMLAKGARDGAQVSLMNGGGIRASIDQGPVTMGEVLEVQPFGNILTLVSVTGAQLKEALENGVSQAETAQGRFPHLGGGRYSWNPAAAPGSRIVSIEVGGAPVDPNSSYRLITLNYLVDGGDGYSIFTQGTNVLNTGFLDSDVTAEYIQANSPVNPQVEGRITEVSAEAPAPAPAPAEPTPAPAPAEPAPAEPAPIPVTLPNTSGENSLFWTLATLGAGAISGGLALRRRVMRSLKEEAAVEAEAVSETEQVEA